MVMDRNKVLLLVVAFIISDAIVLFIIMNNNKNQTPKAFADISPSMVITLSNNKSSIIIDLREEALYKSGHIPGAINIHFNEQNKDKFIKAIKTLDKDKTYIVYSDNTDTGHSVMLMMKDMGFVCVYNIEGGFDRWKKERRAISG